MRSPSLLEQIIEEAKKSPLKKDINKAAFLALMDEIKEALDHGWSMRKIWKVLHDRGSISFSYQAFTVYVNRLILNNNKQKQMPVEAAKKTVEPATIKPDVKPNDKQQQVTPNEKIDKNKDTNIIKDFVFNPTQFSKEDLL